MQSPSVWLRQFREGDSVAAQRLWEVYYPKLVDLARQRLEGRVRAVRDEDDIALSAFKSFCLGIRRGRFPNLDDRHDLWRLLVTITLHKVLHLVRDESRLKRAPAQGAVEIPQLEENVDFDQLIGNEPTPELAAEVAEQCDVLLKQLQSPQLTDLAILKMQGFTNKEIAAMWDRSERTVERKLDLIRCIWSAQPNHRL